MCKPFAVITADHVKVVAQAETKEDALRLAWTRHSLRSEDLEVVWRSCGVPKLWLAFVSCGKIRKTSHWVD